METTTCAATTFINPANNYVERISPMAPVWTVALGSLYMLYQRLWWQAASLFVAGTIMSFFALTTGSSPFTMLLIESIPAFIASFKVRNWIRVRYLQQGWTPVEEAAAAAPADAPAESQEYRL